MMAFAAPLLAAVVLTQFQGGTLQGAVADEGGKPVAGARVLFFAPAPWEGGRFRPVEVQTTTAADGRFRLTVPSLRGLYVHRASLWADRPGSAIVGATEFRPSARALVLRTPSPKTIKLEGPDGRPLAGALVSPRVVSANAMSFVAELPDRLSMPLAVMTGPEGTATVDYLAGGDLLVAVRIKADSIGTQDIQLVEWSGRNAQGATISIRLKRTSRLNGRVRSRAGQPVQSQPVEIWSKGGSLLEPNPVRFNSGPILTAADGSFQTPDNLLLGSPYRVVIRAPAMEPILSDWITIDDKPRVLLPMLQGPLRAIRGRVVDRQGKPLAGIEVFQAGDGPERTTTETDRDGRFTLGGFCQGSVFLFARGDGFRFYGRLVKPDETELKLDLTRINERPKDEMRMLPDPIPMAESQALAQRLLEPYWIGFEEKNEAEKALALRSLVMSDPVGVLQKLDGGAINAREESRLRFGVARALARTDPTRAEAVADSIEGSALRGMILVALADALPDAQLDRKLALLDRAVLEARAATDPATRLYRMGEVAERWFNLGVREKAKTLIAGEFKLAEQVTKNARPGIRGPIAAVLARVDLAAAMAIANEFPVNGTYTKTGALRYIAFGLAADNPAEAERVLRLIAPDTSRDWFHPMIARRMVTVDPARARRLTDESQRYFDNPTTYLFLAHGMKSLDPAGANHAIQTSMHAFDRLMKDGPEYSQMLGDRQVLLPMVEQIDPALVPEFFWRVVANRPSVGNPSSVREASLSSLVALLAWYDRDVAAVLFEPVRDQLERTDESALARASAEFLSWSILDPRAAVARLEKVPVSPKLDLDADSARQRVSKSLRLSHEARWRDIWEDATEMRQMIYPGLW